MTPSVESITNASLINRYLAHVTFKNFDTKEEGSWYQIQWANIRNDLRRLFLNPFKIIAPISYTLASLLVLLGHPQGATPILIAGAVAFDWFSNGSQAGEPPTLTWSHASSGNKKVILAVGRSLNGTLACTFAGASMSTTVNVGGNATAFHTINQLSGARDLVLSGGAIMSGGAISFNNAHLTSPIGATASEDNSASPNGVDLTTTADGSIRVDYLCVDKDNATVPTGTLDAGTKYVDATSAQNQFRESVYGYINAVDTASSTTRTWTTDGFNRKYIAVEIKPDVNSNIGNYPRAIQVGNGMGRSEGAK